jgi:hypothetical protein
VWGIDDFDEDLKLLIISFQKTFFLNILMTWKSFPRSKGHAEVTPKQIYQNKKEI